MARHRGHAAACSQRLPEGWRMSQEGATTLRGDPIVEEVSTWGLFLQALGFTPVDVARGYEVMAEIKGMDRDLDQRRKQLLQQITLAQISGDYQAYNEISDKIITFNSTNPNNPITTLATKLASLLSSNCLSAFSLFIDGRPVFSELIISL